MIRPLILLAAAATIAAPSAALAQAWPAGAAVTASAPVIGRQAVWTQSPLTRSETPAAWRTAEPAALTPATPIDHPATPQLRERIAQVDHVPDVDIRAKDEWTDDQGLRFNFTKLAYKQRF